MTIETDIKTVLDNYAGLSALVGSRNYWGRMPQQPTYPNTVFHRYTNPVNSLSGTNAKMNSRVQVDVRSSTMTNARAVAAQVKLALESATTFKALFLGDEDIEFNPDVKTNRVSMDFSIWHT